MNINLSPRMNHCQFCQFLLKVKNALQSDSMHHTRGVCEGICNRMILHFSYYCKYGILVMTGQTLLMSMKGQNVSWDCLIKLWEVAFNVCNTITL